MDVKIKTEVIEKIIEESKKHDKLEFGGWVIVDNEEIVDVVFDIKSQSYGDVILDCKEILKLDKSVRDKCAGWFHRHPICGLSGTDINTMNQLTEFWGRCYTLVLQGNGDISLHVTDKEEGLIHESWITPEFIDEYKNG